MDDVHGSGSLESKNGYERAPIAVKTLRIGLQSGQQAHLYKERPKIDVIWQRERMEE
jgi:hypothetical protein